MLYNEAKAMAQLSDLVRVVAAASGLEEVQVGWIARHLREAGLIAQGGRGRGGARMSPADAVNLLIGLCCVGSAKELPRQVDIYRAAVCWGCQTVLEGKPAALFENGGRVGDALLWMIEQSVPQSAEDVRPPLVNYLLSQTRIDQVCPGWDADKSGATDLFHALVMSIFTFYYPSFRVSFLIDDTDGRFLREAPAEDFLPKALLDVTYTPEQLIKRSGDRSVRTSISLRTVLEVGRVLAS